MWDGGPLQLGFFIVFISFDEPLRTSEDSDICFELQEEAIVSAVDFFCGADEMFDCLRGLDSNPRFFWSH